MSECAQDIGVSRKIIKKCWSTGLSYKGLTFVLN